MGLVKESPAVVLCVCYSHNLLKDDVNGGARVFFKLTKTLMNSLKNKGKFHGRCYNCGRKFKVGDLSKATVRGRDCRRKWYCLNCVRKLNIWVK